MIDQPEYRTASFVHNGHELVYDVYGDGEHADDEPLLVYLHGLLIDSEVNRGIAGALARRGIRVVLLDLLGHGRSDKPVHAAEYRIDTYAHQLFALLDEIGADQAVVGGMSLGANVSLFAATQRPERLRGVIVEMPVLEWAVPPAALLFAPMVLLTHYGRGLLRVTSSTFRRVPRTRYGPLNSFLNALSLPPRSMAAVLHGVLVGPVAPTLDARGAIDVPALVLAHRADLIHPFDDARNLTDQLSNARLVRARSALQLRMRPGKLTEEIAAFVDDVWAHDGTDATSVGA